MIEAYSHHSAVPLERTGIMVDALSCRHEPKDCLRTAPTAQDEACARTLAGNTYVTYSMGEHLQSELRKLGRADKRWSGAPSLLRIFLQREPSVTLALQRVLESVGTQVPQNEIAGVQHLLSDAVTHATGLDAVADDGITKYAESVRAALRSDKEAATSSQRAAAALSASGGQVDLIAVEIDEDRSEDDEEHDRGDDVGRQSTATTVDDNSSSDVLRLPNGAHTQWRRASDDALRYELSKPFPPRLQRYVLGNGRVRSLGGNDCCHSLRLRAKTRTCCNRKRKIEIRRTASSVQHETKSCTKAWLH